MSKTQNSFGAESRLSSKAGESTIYRLDALRKAGIGNILDVLSAQSALASARQQDVLARYQLALAKVALIHSLGGLELATFAKSGR